MDDIFSIIFFIWIAYAILESIVRKKNIPTPQEQPTEIDFEIPILENDPNAKIQSPQSSESKIIQQQKVSQAIKKSNVGQESYLNFTSDDAMNAMVLAEIFSKPKSLRKK